MITKILALDWLKWICWINIYSILSSLNFIYIFRYQMIAHNSTEIEASENILIITIEKKHSDIFLLFFLFLLKISNWLEQIRKIEHSFMTFFFKLMPKQCSGAFLLMSLLWLNRLNVIANQRWLWSIIEET